jgi:adenine/guanine phosphoribosyltransferase-like PRPP-binding protein
MSTTPDRTYTTTVGSQKVELPLIALNEELTIALLICVDMGVDFAETAGRELAEVMGPSEPDIIVSVATMGIPLAIEASRSTSARPGPSRCTPSRPTSSSGSAWTRPG